MLYEVITCKPEGNEKALRYMKVAETEGIPIHFYIFTPGSYPVEEYPGAAQQIARNIYTMTKLVITSYSIHYTKLYDRDLVAFSDLSFNGRSSLRGNNRIVTMGYP